MGHPQTDLSRVADRLGQRLVCQGGLVFVNRRFSLRSGCQELLAGLVRVFLSQLLSSLNCLLRPKDVDAPQPNVRPVIARCQRRPPILLGLGILL